MHRLPSLERTRVRPTCFFPEAVARILSSAAAANAPCWNQAARAAVSPRDVVAEIQGIVRDIRTLNEADMDEEQEGLVTSMLAYCCADRRMVEGARAAGLRPADDGLRIYDAYAAASEACLDMLLVIDVFAVERAGADLYRFVPSEAVTNLKPYRRPVPVTAGGGFVIRRSADGAEVLLILRRGVWDLPKGKLDAGETIPACALREVREEIGIDAVHLVRRLGATIHGYPDDSAYAVKTTHWFEMETTERHFEPETGEDISEVDWVAWPEARRRLGFESLRRHMKRIEHLILTP